MAHQARQHHQGIAGLRAQGVGNELNRVWKQRHCCSGRTERERIIDEEAVEAYVCAAYVKRALLTKRNALHSGALLKVL